MLDFARHFLIGLSLALLFCMVLLLLISFQKGERILYLGQVPSNDSWLGSLLLAREGER